MPAIRNAPTRTGPVGDVERVLADVEHVLRDGQARIQAILLSAIDAIITIDASGVIESFNPAAEQMFGYAAAEAVGQPVAILMPRSYGAEHQGHIDRYLAGGRAAAVGARRRVVGQRKDGTVFPIELAVNEVRVGNRILFTGIVRDISEREQADLELRTSQQFFRATLDSLSQHIAILDDHGRILEVNQAWKSFAQHNAMHAAAMGVGDNYLEICGRSSQEGCEDAAQVAAGIRQVIGGQSDHFRLEYPCHSADERRWFVVHVTRFVSDAGVRAVVTHENITARKLAELALQQAKDAAETGNRMKDVFLAMLGHELRNPLAPIRHAVAVLRRPDTPAVTQQESLRTLGEQVDHVIRLVDDLLDLSRITQDKIRIRRQPLDLRDCIRRAVEATHALIEQRQHVLRLELPPQPLVIEGDPDRLQQIIANLLNNAAKYTPPGGEIDLLATAQNGSAVLDVCDNGAGLTELELRRVFEPFIQGLAAHADSQGGMGIGLTLVRRLVELHGGTVQAYSQGAGHGSEFIVRLPLAAAATPAANPTATDSTAANRAGAVRESGAVSGSPAPGAVRGSPDPAPPPARTILVIDDNATAAEMLATLLRLDGHRVDLAPDGETGITRAQQLRPDLVLLDLRMPGIDGYETARRLRAHAETAALTLVALTGLGNAFEDDRDKRALFDEYLVKPVEPARLNQLLASLPAPTSPAPATPPPESQRRLRRDGPAESLPRAEDSHDQTFSSDLQTDRAAQQIAVRVGGRRAAARGRRS